MKEFNKSNLMNHLSALESNLNKSICSNDIYRGNVDRGRWDAIRLTFIMLYRQLGPAFQLIQNERN